MSAGADQLLTPTYLELAERMRSKAHSRLHSARKFGNTPKGRAAFEDALSYRRIAHKMLDRHYENLRLRDYGRTGNAARQGS